MDAKTRTAITLALKALRQVEWSGDLSVWSPVCRWCGGYQRHPAMDQDYHGKAGHKDDCPRQRAVTALESLLAAPPDPQD